MVSIPSRSRLLSTVLRRNLALKRYGRGGELGGYDRRPVEATVAQHLADDPLRSAVAVHLRRVNKGDPLGHARPEGLTHVATVDRKSTRLNSSHANISYAVFCLKKKTQT